MELIKVDYRTNEADGKTYEGTYYTLGDCYRVVRYTVKYEDGTEFTRISITEDGEYIPSISYEDDFFGERKPRFEIQTTAYGAKSPEEIRKVIDGYNTALEAVEVLTKAFC